MATWVNNWLSGLITIRPNDESQEPARSQSTSISIDARISVYPLGDHHPLAPMFGKYADDPMWRELEAIIDRNRADDNANDDIQFQSDQNVYILDTNVLRVIFGNRGAQPLLESRIKQTPFEQLYISIVSAEEVLRGILELFRRYERDQKLPQAYTFVENLLVDLSRYQILAFDDSANERYREMSAETKRRGKGDCRIAASALVRGYKVITRNEADFRAIGAACENWFI